MPWLSWSLVLSSRGVLVQESRHIHSKWSEWNWTQLSHFSVVSAFVLIEIFVIGLRCPDNSLDPYAYFCILVLALVWKQFNFLQAILDVFRQASKVREFFVETMFLLMWFINETSSWQVQRRSKSLFLQKLITESRTGNELRSDVNVQNREVCCYLWHVATLSTREVCGMYGM